MENGIEMNRPTWVEVDLTKLNNNFKRIKEKVNFRNVIAVVKADAYGLGAVQIARTLEENGVFAFAVASMEEALSLRENGIRSPILVLGYVDTRKLYIASKNDIRVTLFDKDFIKRLKEYKNDEILKIHVKVDTGMHRIGVDPSDVPFVFESISYLPNVSVEGLYTHFASAFTDPEFTNLQIQRFDGVVEFLKNRNALPKVIHASNSAAILGHKNAYYNTVRPGILLYGISPDSKISLENNFEEVISLKTRIIKVTDLKKGERISYGGTYETQEDSTIATLPIGYADGVPRNLSNRGFVLVKGKRAPIVGTITMDMMMIDVTGLPYIHPGNEVVIVGSQGDEKIKMNDFSELANTIPYEILVRLNKRIRRVYKRED